jgi:hypothetical protein
MIEILLLSYLNSSERHSQSIPKRFPYHSIEFNISRVSTKTTRLLGRGKVSSYSGSRGEKLFIGPLKGLSLVFFSLFAIIGLISEGENL